VKHSELAVSTSTGRIAVVVQPDDTLTIIDLLLVTDLEFRDTADAA
jgi:DNA-binding beta-propeller fold protein YncE